MTTVSTFSPFAAKERRTLFVVAVGVVVLRIGLCLLALESPHRHLFPDSFEYLRLATNVSSGLGFTQHPNGLPETGRTPGFPLAVALVRVWAGGNTVPAVLFLQAVLVLVPAFLLVRLLPSGPKRCRGALVLLAVIAVDPLSLGLSAAVLSESLFLSLSGLRLALLMRSALGARYGVALLGGVTSGIMALVRPIAGYLWLVDAISLWLMADRGRWRHVLFALVGFGIVVAPWIVRNSTYGVWGLSSNSGAQLLFWNAAIIESRARGISLAEMRGEYRVRYSATPHPGREALRVFAERPWALVRTTAYSVGTFAADPGHQWLLKPLGLPGSGILSTGSARRPGAIVSLLVLIACTALTLAVWTLALLALNQLWSANRSLFWIAALTIAYFGMLSVHVNLAEGARFRAPIIPVLALLAAIGASGPGRTMGIGSAPQRGTGPE